MAGKADVVGVVTMLMFMSFVVWTCGRSVGRSVDLLLVFFVHLDSW